MVFSFDEYIYWYIYNIYIKCSLKPILSAEGTLTIQPFTLI